MSNEQETRGKELGAAIDKLYNDMKQRQVLRPSGQGRNFITEAITKYIPVGSTFEDAEAILRAAGCKITGPSSRTVGRLPTDINVVAEKTIEVTAFGGVNIWVDLTPPNSTDYTFVSKISAEFILNSL